MIIYNYLFLHIYELALRSKSNKDMPVFITVTVITMCFMFNIFTIFLCLEGAGIIKGIELFPKEFKVVGAITFLLLVAGYYMYKGRYKRIHEKCISKYGSPKTFKAIVVVVSYYVVSFFLMLLAGLYKNGDWIFRWV